jgi:hypothetical protein
MSPGPLPIPVRRQFRCRRGSFSHSRANTDSPVTQLN